VVPFYERILGKYSTIESLADASYDEFFPYYQWLGYYSRARNLLKTANIVSIEYAGVFPQDKTKLKKLPGVGEYTARAILAFGYGDAFLAWDTNLETIFSRYYHWAKNIKLTEDEKSEIERDFQWFVARHCEERSNPENQKPGSPHSTIAAFAMTEAVRNINNALMDWARISEPKTANLLNTENYIFTESEFYKTKWSSEVIEKKISVSFPTPDAQVVVILHQDHRVYYSEKLKVKSWKVSNLDIGTSTGESYSPFILPASEDRDTRRYVQDFFRTQYSLELSVRPVHKKWLSKDGHPYIAVNAQIQAGDASVLRMYGKSDMKISIEQLYSL
jgi:A/G-specific adenine glycosylase